MAQAGDRYFIILKPGLRKPEHNFFKLWGRELVDKESGERVVILRGTAYAVAEGSFARITVVDPEDETVHHELLVPLQFVMAIGVDEHRLPVGFTSA